MHRVLSERSQCNKHFAWLTICVIFVSNFILAPESPIVYYTSFTSDVYKQERCVIKKLKNVYTEVKRQIIGMLNFGYPILISKRSHTFQDTGFTLLFRK